MAEEAKMNDAVQAQKPKRMVPPQLDLDSMKDSQMRMISGSAPSSPVGARKTTATKMNCLCSPTTHVGSFRCRYHRNSGLGRSSLSVGSKLNELAGKPVGICGGLPAR